MFEGALLSLAVPEHVIWTGNIDGDVSLLELCVNDGVLEMATSLQETEEKLTILALGPLTDIAWIVLNFPQVLDKIEEIVFLHPNQRGHRIVAEYIYEYMKENILNSTN